MIKVAIILQYGYNERVNYKFCPVNERKNNNGDADITANGFGLV